MIKIGDFSNLAHVSIKTLHHYDELGLLKPVQVDRYSGYRYYEIGQLSMLNRILALKDLGFNLQQVASLMQSELSISEMRGMLRLKQMELEKQVDEDQARLLRVEHRLQQLEMDGKPPVSEVVVKDMPAQTALLAHIVAANEQALLPARESLLTLLVDHLRTARLQPATPWFALYEDLSYREKDLEFTLGIGVRLRRDQQAHDWQATPIRLLELEAVPSMASLVHTSGEATLPQAYASLFTWMQSNGFQPAGAYREFYLSETGAYAAPDLFPHTGVIEVQCPVKEASVPVSLLSDKKEKTMQPKIISRPAFKAVGLSYVGKNEHGEIGQMWGRFNQVCQPIKSINDKEAFGLCFSRTEVVTRPGEFEYVACFEVADDKDVPSGMVFRQVPAHRYAVFTHHGKLDTLGQTYQYIYNTGLAQAGLKLHPDMFDMEVYGKDFCLGSDASRFYIYVAIE